MGETQPRRPKRGSGEGYISQRRDASGRPIPGQWRGELQVGTRPDGKPDIRHVSGRTRRDVQDALRLLRNEHAAGTLGPAGQRTYHQLYEAWLRDVAAVTVRPTTLDLYRKASAHLYPTLGHLPLRQLTAEHVARLYADLTRRGLAASYVRTIARALSVTLHYAVRLNLVPRNVAQGVRLPPLTRSMRALTEEETRRLLDSGHRLAPQPWPTILELALASGARLGELLGARWTNFDRAKRTWTIDRTLIRRYPSPGGRTGNNHTYHAPKSARSRRTIKLPPQLFDTLQQWRRQQAEHRLLMGPEWEGVGDDAELVFTKPTGAPTQDQNVRWWLRRVLADAGLPPTTRFHDLRHTHATQLLTRGEQISVVSQRLGHSSAAITLGVYAHVLDGQDDAAADRIGSLLYGTR